MGRQMPTECLHGYVIDPGDFEAVIEKCPYCERAKNFSYDTRCAELADVFLSEEASATMPNNIYQYHASCLAQEIQDVVESFCSHDDDWKKAKSKFTQDTTAGHRHDEAGPVSIGPEPVHNEQEPQ